MQTVYTKYWIVDAVRSAYYMMADKDKHIFVAINVFYGYIRKFLRQKQYCASLSLSKYLCITSSFRISTTLV